MPNDEVLMHLVCAILAQLSFTKNKKTFISEMQDFT